MGQTGTDAPGDPEGHEERGIEFYFAQFVDMYAARQSLFPRLVEPRRSSRRGGLRRLRRGEIGQVPSDPDIAAIPDLSSLPPVPWEKNLARFACDVTWRARSGRTARARFCAACSPGPGGRLRAQDHPGAEYFLLNQREDGRPRSPTRRHPREALLRPEGAVEDYDFLTTVSRY